MARDLSTPGEILDYLHDHGYRVIEYNNYQMVLRRIGSGKKFAFKGKTLEDALEMFSSHLHSGLIKKPGG